jgi:hypothetical protein
MAISTISFASPLVSTFASQRCWIWRVSKVQRFFTTGVASAGNTSRTDVSVRG